MKNLRTSTSLQIRGNFVSKKYQSGRLKIDFWKPQSYSGAPNPDQDFIDEYRKVAELKTRVYWQIRQINKILERRESYINIYREISDKLSHDTFEPLPKDEKQSLEDEHTHYWELITIDTETYFIYAKILLDKLIGIVKHYDNSFQDIDNNFTELWKDIMKNGCNDKQLEHYIQNDAKWFQLMVRVPRNIIFVHDFKTLGAGGGDHGIDFGITKSTEKASSLKTQQTLILMKKDHLPDFPELANEKNSFQIIRGFDHDSEKLTFQEIQKLEQIHMRIGGMFPYVIEVNPKIQKLLDFFAEWTKQKITNSILTKHIP